MLEFLVLTNEYWYFSEHFAYLIVAGYWSVVLWSVSPLSVVVNCTAGPKPFDLLISFEWYLLIVDLFGGTFERLFNPVQDILRHLISTEIKNIPQYKYSYSNYLWH